MSVFGPPFSAGTRCLLVTMAVFLAAMPSAAQEIVVEASLDRAQASVNGQLNLTVTVTASGASTGVRTGEPEIQIPEVLDVMGSSSSSSTSIQFVNGAMSSTVTQSYMYLLRPTKVGTFTIGPARVKAGSKTTASGTMQVEVVASAARRQQPQARARTPVSSEPGNPGEIEENLFILATPDKKQVRVGEQVTLTYKLYTRYNIQQLAYNRLPSYKGFWAETVYEAPRTPTTTQEVVDGKAYSTIVLRRIALFPTTAGSPTLEQLELRCDVPVRSSGRSTPDDFFSFDPFGRTQQVLVRSQDVTLDVRPLPEGATAGFDGSVGDYTISMHAKPTEVRSGDPVSLTVTVSGRGHLNSVSEPHRTGDAAFRVYDPKVTTETSAQQDRFGGKKTFEYVVIPSRPGRLAAPTFELVYYDPASGRYQTRKTEPLVLNVMPGEAPEAVSQGLNRQEVRRLGEDIRHIKPDAGGLSDQGGPIYTDWRFYAMQAVPVLGFLLAFSFRRHQERLAGDVAYARRRRSRAEARRRLSEAERLMQTDDRRAFYTEVHNAAMTFLADRFNLPSAGMTAERAASALASRNVDDDLIRRLRELVETCDFARFAPAGAAVGQMETVYEAAEGLIDDLGNGI